jgi:hypothetical protein
VGGGGEIFAVAPGGGIQGSAKWASGGKINLEKINFLH